MQSILLKLRHFLRVNYFDLIHALKAGIAFLIAYLIYALVPHSGISLQWLFVSILVSMSALTALGMQIDTSLGQIWATLLGAGAAIAASFSPHFWILLPIYLILAVIIFIFITVNSERFGSMASLGLITFIVIIFNENSKLQYALERTGEIIAGICIALIVSRFIMPIRSVRLIRQRALINLERLVELYQNVLVEHKNRFKEEQFIKLESKIIASLNIQNQLLSTVKYENRLQKRRKHNIHLAIRYQQAIYSYYGVIEITRRILTEMLTKDHEFFKLLTIYLQQVIEFINDFIKHYPKISDQKLKELQVANNQLVRYVQVAQNNPSALSGIYTICFVTQRITYSCWRLERQLQVMLK